MNNLLRSPLRARGAALLLTALLTLATTTVAQEPTSPPTTAAAPPTLTVSGLLTRVNIEPRDVGIRPAELELIMSAAPTSPFTRLMLTEPLRSEAYAAVTADALRRGARAQPVDVLSTLGRLSGGMVRRGLIGDPAAAHVKAAKADGALVEALRGVGGSWLRAEELDAVPPSVQQAATVLLLAAQAAEADVARALASVGDQRFLRKVAENHAEPLRDARTTTPEPPPDADYDLQFKQAKRAFQGQLALAPAQDLLFALAAARKILQDDPTLATADFLVTLQTRRGAIILAGSAANTHTTTEPILLIIDTGGDDTYAQAGAAAGPDQPIGLALDLAGNDTYAAADGALGSFGAGMFGIGLLFDEAGDDTYTGGRHTQGVGVFGVGLLLDRAGNDQYAAIGDSQAHGTAGFGVLLDLAGDDTYEAFVASQAFARPNAGAALIDLGGDDRYTANNSDIRFPSPQDPKHNISMCQGAAVGDRQDYVDGLSLSGGVAVLLDSAGDDTYSCGVFGQGTGYWNGTGVLIDESGNDTYTGHWYVQGSSAHFAVGLMFDRTGNDTYQARRNMAQGAGHDVGVGVLVDAAGNDTYTTSTLGLGASNAAGVGVFVDRAGDDTYRAPAGQCLGWVNDNGSWRGLFRAYGLFFDLAGNDTYVGRDDAPPRRGPANGVTWTLPAAEAGLTRTTFGYGFDAE